MVKVVASRPGTQHPRSLATKLQWHPINVHICTRIRQTVGGAGWGGGDQETTGLPALTLPAGWPGAL